VPRPVRHENWWDAAKRRTPCCKSWATRSQSWVAPWGIPDHRWFPLRGGVCLCQRTHGWNYEKVVVGSNLEFFFFFFQGKAGGL
jgi:hypothetical protein